LNFKGFRFELIFNLNAVFTTHVLKVAPIRMHFSLGFPPGAGFPGEQSHEELTTWVKTGFSRLQRGARSMPEHSSPDCEPAGTASVEKVPVFRHSSVVLEAR
jgi:hypothetical protein